MLQLTDQYVCIIYYEQKSLFYLEQIIFPLTVLYCKVTEELISTSETISFENFKFVMAKHDNSFVLSIKHQKCCLLELNLSECHKLILNSYNYTIASISKKSLQYEFQTGRHLLNESIKIFLDARQQGKMNTIKDYTDHLEVIFLALHMNDKSKLHETFERNFFEIWQNYANLLSEKLMISMLVAIIGKHIQNEELSLLNVRISKMRKLYKL